MDELNIALVGLMVVLVTALSKGFDLGLEAFKKRRANGVPSLREQQRNDIRELKKVLIEDKPGSPSLVSMVRANTKALTDHLSDHKQDRA